MLGAPEGHRRKYSARFLRPPSGAKLIWARGPGAAFAGADLPPANFLRRAAGAEAGAPAAGLRLRGTEPDRQAILHRLRLITANDPRPLARAATLPIYQLTGWFDPIVPWPSAAPGSAATAPATATPAPSPTPTTPSSAPPRTRPPSRFSTGLQHRPRESPPTSVHATSGPIGSPLSKCKCSRGPIAPWFSNFGHSLVPFGARARARAGDSAVHAASPVPTAKPAAPAPSVATPRLGTSHTDDLGPGNRSAFELFFSFQFHPAQSAP